LVPVTAKLNYNNVSIRTAYAVDVDGHVGVALGLGIAAGAVGAGDLVVLAPAAAMTASALVAGVVAGRTVCVSRITRAHIAAAGSMAWTTLLELLLKSSPTACSASVDPLVCGVLGQLRLADLVP
jgi:hypothetical protein